MSIVREELKRRARVLGTRHERLLEALIEDLDAYFAPIRAKYEEIKADPSIVADVLLKGGAEARAVSGAKMTKVRAAIGVA